MSVPGSRAGVRGGESVPAGAIAYPQLASEKDKKVKILIFLGQRLYKYNLN